MGERLDRLTRIWDISYTVQYSVHCILQYTMPHLKMVTILTLPIDSCPLHQGSICNKTRRSSTAGKIPPFTKHCKVCANKPVTHNTICVQCLYQEGIPLFSWSSLPLFLPSIVPLFKCSPLFSWSTFRHVPPFPSSPFKRSPLPCSYIHQFVPGPLFLSSTLFPLPPLFPSLVPPFPCSYLSPLPLFPFCYFPHFPSSHVHFFTLFSSFPVPSLPIFPGSPVLPLVHIFPSSPVVLSPSSPLLPFLLFLVPICISSNYSL